MTLASDIAIIPQPWRCERSTGYFTLTAETALTADAAHEQSRLYCRDLLAKASGFPLPDRLDGPGIRLQQREDLAELGPEGYELKVTTTEVTIGAPTTAGVFYGLQTLRQLLPPAIERASPESQISWQIPCVLIVDRPRFAWRGYMLDEGRHFQGKDAVLETLDLMALQKLNIFHWHLTEDQGWRIAINRYPLLTEVGAFRPETRQGLFGRHDGIPHGGFYTQDDVREIVAYAAARHITVVPEIEMPGHSSAALAAYPELGCTGQQKTVPTRFGIFRDIYCAGREKTFEFLQNVLDEVMDLFPGPYIHVGGDEAPKSRWKKCPRCQERMRTEGLSNPRQLQVYFTNRMARYLDDHGRRLVGWNEILEDGLVESAIGQYWVRHKDRVIAEAERGREIVVSPFLDVYLDHGYALTPLDRTYACEPIFPELSEAAASSIVGIEAPLWTEFVSSKARRDYQVYPRLTAVAEIGWSMAENRDFVDFQWRLGPFLARLDYLGIGYAGRHEWASSRLKQKLALATILQPQTKTAGDS